MMIETNFSSEVSAPAEDQKYVCAFTDIDSSVDGCRSDN